MNSDSHSGCIIANCKEREDYIIVKDKPSPKRCELEPEENLHHTLIPGNRNYIANCFALYFEKNHVKV